MSKKKKQNVDNTKAYETQAVTQPDAKDKKTKAAIPNDTNVEIAREWVDTNKK